MTGKLRIASICLVILAVVVIVSFVAAFRAVRSVPDYYQQALDLDDEVLATSGRELESRPTALYSDAQQVGRWQASFTADQINGWLAVQLAENLADQLPDQVRDPRVAISRDDITLGFLSDVGGSESVITVKAAVYVTESGEIAVQLISVHAGSVPMPVLQVADQLAAACQSLSLPVRWTRYDNQPVAMIDLSLASTSDKRYMEIDFIEIEDRLLLVAGHTEAGPRPQPPPEFQAAPPAGQ